MGTLEGNMVDLLQGLDRLVLVSRSLKTSDKVQANCGDRKHIVGNKEVHRGNEAVLRNNHWLPVEGMNDNI